MAHPFHANIPQPPAASNNSRRSFLSFLIAGVGGMLALWSARPATAQIPRRYNLGDRRSTTRAVGEEGAGGGATYPRMPRYTTQAVGEEGGRYTTYATGEEGSGGRVTTYAFGEEGAYYYMPARPPRSSWAPRPGSGTVTTFALGEEG